MPLRVLTDFVPNGPLDRIAAELNQIGKTLSRLAPDDSIHFEFKVGPVKNKKPKGKENVGN